MITDKQLEKAQKTMFQWFLEQNAKEPEKSITMIDTTISWQNEQFRLITHMSFYGRDEKIKFRKSVKENV